MSESFSEFREQCWECRRSRKSCLCSKIKPFKSQPLIVLLVHPRESRNSVGTARIAHLCLSNSILIQGDGFGFDQNPKIRALVEDPRNLPFVLYPGEKAEDLSTFDKNPGDPHQRFVIFVIDGTWSTAKRMIRRSEILMNLPQIRFQPTSASTYRIRKEPAFECVSTVEAVHTLLREFEGPRVQHENLLQVFDAMVDFQLQFNDPSVHI